MKNQPRLETRLPELRAELGLVYAEMDAAGERWLELRAGDVQQSNARRNELRKIEARTNDLIDQSRRIERKIRTAEKRASPA